MIGALVPAVVNRLLATGGVTALVGTRVHDGEAPAGTARPYIVVADPTAVPGEVLGRAGRRATVTVHVWSEYRGSTQALGIADAVEAALTGTALTVTGYATTRLRLEFATVLVESETERHAVLRFGVLGFGAAA